MKFLFEKKIEQIKLEQQNLKETLEKVNQKVDKLLEQRNTGSSEEQKLNNLLKQFNNFGLGEKSVIRIEQKINPFEPKSLVIKPVNSRSYKP